MDNIYSQLALKDIAEIWLYIADDSTVAADRVVSEIEKACRFLNQFSGIGEGFETFRRGMRRFHVGQYMIFYKVLDAGINVVRIVHGARDIDSIFREMP